jgi:hypothetical protein
MVGASGSLGNISGTRRGSGGVVGMAGMGGLGTGGNFNVSGISDRRTAISMGNLGIDSAVIPDIFGRRSSLGLDDSFFGRRDSLESSTAMIDACILDLTRRRLSMAMGSPSQSATMNNDIALQSSVPITGLPSSSVASNQSFSSQNSLSAIASRQQQIQQQQLELDKRQKEIDLQRQQLFVGLQDQAAHVSGMGGYGTQLSAGGFGNSNVGAKNLNRAQLKIPSTSAQQTQSNTQRPCWWICQVCKKRAFASRQEATNHELICAESRESRIMDHRQTQFQQAHVEQMKYHNVGNRSIPNSSQLNHQQASTMPLFTAQDMLDTNDERSFSVLHHPLPLAMSSDKEWLTPLHCFVRKHCVEVFCASSQDVSTPSKGKRKPIQIGQVGIRCPHCQTSSAGAVMRERGSVYYPTTISSIYNATMNLLQRHLHACPSFPDDLKGRYKALKADDARSGTSKKYWIESALSLGLVDTENGIRFSTRRPPPLPRPNRQHQSAAVAGGLVDSDLNDSSNIFTSNATNRNDDGIGIDSNMGVTFDDVDENGSTSYNGERIDALRTEFDSKTISSVSSLVTLEDKPYATAFSFELLSQMQPCVFTEADRLGKRKGLPTGFAGLACRHCFGGYGSGRFFPSSIKTLSDTSKTLNVLYNHMLRCRKCPLDVKESLQKFKIHHDDERAKMKFGSQKAFFAKIWSRLHDRDNSSLIEQYSMGTRQHNQPNRNIGQSEEFIGSNQSAHLFNLSTLSQLPNDFLAGFDAFANQGNDFMNKRQRVGL